MTTSRNSKYVKMHANCIVTKGYTRSLICDMQFGSYQFIANELGAIFQAESHIAVDDLYSKFGESEHETISEYLDYLERADFIFYTDDPELFPDLDKTWENPATLTNVIIDFTNAPEQLYLDSIVHQLNNLDCHAVQLRMFYNCTEEDVKFLLKSFDDSVLRAIELHFKDIRYIEDNEKVELLIDNYPRINKIVVFSANHNNEIIYNNVQILHLIIPITSDCGNVNPKYFCLTMENILESHCYNSCLNRKLYIGSAGEIKNCPFSHNSFGNVSDKELTEIISSPEFKQLWSITKDNIDVCKDCEFRYICIDCRVYIKNISDILSQPSKCLYNPYIAKWQGEVGYVSVEECCLHPIGSRYVVDDNKVSYLNSQLWEI